MSKCKETGTGTGHCHLPTVGRCRFSVPYFAPFPFVHIKDANHPRLIHLGLQNLQNKKFHWIKLVQFFPARNQPISCESSIASTCRAPDLPVRQLLFGPKTILMSSHIVVFLYWIFFNWFRSPREWRDYLFASSCQLFERSEVIVGHVSKRRRKSSLPVNIYKWGDTSV